MLKLYKNINGQFHYWETWDNGKSATIHWGIVGEKGESKEMKSGLLANYKSKIQKEIDKLIENGYKEIDSEDHFMLLIEFIVEEGMGKPEDLDKRYALQERMDNILGWVGIGHCDGGSTGSGTMEVACLVVDFEVAKSIIENDLKGTAFGNYSRIYNERSINN